jgi:hypothetical protein
MRRTQDDGSFLKTSIPIAVSLKAITKLAVCETGRMEAR